MKISFVSVDFNFYRFPLTHGGGGYSRSLQKKQKKQKDKNKKLKIITVYTRI